MNTSNAPSPPSCPGLAPVCRLLGFGDNAADLELRFRISAPQNGTANLRSQVLLGVWDRFHAEAIEFPVPRRDLHLASLPEIGVRVTQAAKAPGGAQAAENPTEGIVAQPRLHIRHTPAPVRGIQSASWVARAKPVLGAINGWDRWDRAGTRRPARELIVSD